MSSKYPNSNEVSTSSRERTKLKVMLLQAEAASVAEAVVQAVGIVTLGDGPAAAVPAA
jgi:hypothetical protein